MYLVLHYCYSLVFLEGGILLDAVGFQRIDTLHYHNTSSEVPIIVTVTNACKRDDRIWRCCWGYLLFVVVDSTFSMLMMDFST